MDKIKLMSIGKKKPKAENLNSWSKTVERYAPDLYDLFYGAGEKDSFKKVAELQPEIVLLLYVAEDGNLEYRMQLVKEIKQLSPKTMIFVTFDVLDAQEDVFDEYIGCGAMKCYTSPVSMEALFHDMYVALNME